MTNYVRKLLNDAQAAGLKMTVYRGGCEPNYSGYDPAEAEETINGTEEVELELHDNDGNKLGWTIIQPDLKSDEMIVSWVGWTVAGCEDWIDHWIKENIPS